MIGNTSSVSCVPRIVMLVPPAIGPTSGSIDEIFLMSSEGRLVVGSEKSESVKYVIKDGLVLGINCLLFYETRSQWNDYNPQTKGLKIPTSRTAPLGGEYVARVPSTTSENVEKITHGYSTSGLKGAGIRVYEYASSETIKNCRLQLEYLYWNCFDSMEVSINAGMTKEYIILRKVRV